MSNIDPEIDEREFVEVYTGTDFDSVPSSDEAKRFLRWCLEDVYATEGRWPDPTSAEFYTYLHACEVHAGGGPLA